jgi:hypothetical protein
MNICKRRIKNIYPRSAGRGDKSAPGIGDFPAFFGTEKVNADKEAFDFALNLTSIGWGKDLSSDKSYGHVSFDFFNLYIEHMDTRLGMNPESAKCPE